MRSLSIIAAASFCLLLACDDSKSDDGKAKDAKKADEGADDGKAKDAKPKASGPDFSKWDQPAKEKAWQGGWLAKENGTIQAWFVEGDSVKTWDGKEEKTAKLTFESPCRAGFEADGGMTFPRPFAAVGGKLRYGAGGYRKGGEAIFCDDSGDTYVVDAAGKCSLHEERFGEWKSKPGECGIKKNDAGAEVFFHGDPNSGEWTIEGDAIVPNGSFPTEAVEGDFAAAKAARDAKAAE